MKPKCVVFFGPSGVGKSTLIKLLMKEYPGKFSFTVSHTTRQMRLGEENGVDYNFISLEEFKGDIAKGKFIEWTVFSGNHYGTSKDAIVNATKDGSMCILDLDLNGVRSMKQIDDFDSTFILIKPSSIEELRNRLENRGTEESVLKMRIKKASEDMGSLDNEEFDLVLVNDVLNETFENLRSFVKILI